MNILYISAALVVLFSSCNSDSDRKLPILGERYPVEKEVDGRMITDTVYRTIPPFKFINQDSAFITEKDFDGKIYVADFFFTSCTSICPVMHRNMLDVYEKFKDNPNVKLLSHSIDFKYDTPARLKSYAEKLGISGNSWQFVRGTKEEIYGLAEKSYLVAVSEDSAAADGFIHQGWFILVDKQKRLRGAYDGTKPEAVKQLISDMQILLKEDEK